MSEKILTGITIGIHEEVDDLKASINQASGRMVIDLNTSTHLVIKNAGVLHSLADTIKQLAEEWDKQEADKTHADRVVDSIKNPGS